MKNSEALVSKIIRGKITISSKIITQENCLHGSKVKMPGYKNLFECLTCHKFLDLTW